jgi:hypothetical protein
MTVKKESQRQTKLNNFQAVASQKVKISLISISEEKNASRKISFERITIQKIHKTKGLCSCDLFAHFRGKFHAFCAQCIAANA